MNQNTQNLLFMTLLKRRKKEKKEKKEKKKFKRKQKMKNKDKEKNLILWKMSKLIKKNMLMEVVEVKGNQLKKK